MKSKVINFIARPIVKLFYNENNNYGIYKIKLTDEEYMHIENIAEKEAIEALEEDFNNDCYYAIICGSMQSLDLYTNYKFECSVKYNKKYSNYQFFVYKATLNVPKTITEQEDFLKVLVTENQAKNLLAVYPDIVEKIINGGEDIDLDKIPCIGESTFGKIKTKIIDNYIISDLLSTLAPLGITYNQIKKISTLSTNPVLLKQQLNKNPYILTQVNGLGFKKVDGIALKINSKLKISKLRSLEFIKYVLEDMADSIGHTWVEKIDIIERARKNIPECLNIIKEIIDTNDFDNSIFYIEGDKIGLMRNYKIEKNIYQDLNRINNSEFNFEPISEDELNNIILNLEQKQGFVYSEEQKDIIKKSNNKSNNVIIVSGSAGSGKSTVLKGILSVISSMKCIEKNEDEIFHTQPCISQCSLSAKAAIRMQETTGRPASTIHRLLVFQKNGFAYNRNCKLMDDVIIVDELSMNNISICNSLFQAVKNGCKLILVFDHAQLPPIGAGAVAYDLLEYSNFIKVKFTEIHRQAKSSGILVDANSVRVQKNPIKKLEQKIIHGELRDMRYVFSTNRNEMRKYAVKQFFNALNKYGIDDVSIITPRKNTVVNSALEVNKIIQDKYLPLNKTEEMKMGNKSFRIGDKVIHRKNNSDQNVFNGEIGYVFNIDYEIDKNNNKIKTLYVKYKDFIGLEDYKIVKYSSLEEFNQLELGYTLTTHSMQGSQAKAIIILLDNTHYNLLDNTMLYTAITRAEKHCMLIAEPGAFKRCILVNKTVIRQTFLKRFFKKELIA